MDSKAGSHWKRGQDDRWLWRFPSRRLEAEAIRDGMLFLSGELNDQMGGPGFNFFKSRGGLTGFPPVEKFGPNELRRMIYAHKIRMEPTPVFGAFDCPDAGQPLPKRSQSTTAIQSLNLFNSPFVIDRAGKFADRVKMEHLAQGWLGSERSEAPSISKPGGSLRSTPATPTTPARPIQELNSQVKTAFQLAFGREPQSEELSSASAIVERHGLDTLCRVLLNANEFLFLP